MGVSSSIQLFISIMNDNFVCFYLIFMNDSDSIMEKVISVVYKGVWIIVVQVHDTWFHVGRCEGVIDIWMNLIQVFFWYYRQLWVIKILLFFYLWLFCETLIGCIDK